jgi:uncharacterized protein (DUF111 family)
MLQKGFANIGAFREEVKRLAKQFNVEVTDIHIHEVAKRGQRTIDVLVEERFDIDPTEESNAVCWGDN